MILNFCDSNSKNFCLVLFLWRSHTVLALVMLINTAEYDSRLMQPMLLYLRGIFVQQLTVIDELLIFFWLLNLVIVMSITKCCFRLVYINVVSMSLALELKWICKWAWSTSWWFILVFSKILLHFLWIKYHSQGRFKSISCGNGWSHFFNEPHIKESFHVASSPVVFAPHCHST